VENVPLHRYENHSLDFLQGGEGELPKLHSLLSLRGCLNSGDELKGIIIARKFFYTSIPKFVSLRLPGDTPISQDI